MSFTSVAGFWAVSFLFVITPGADWAYAITAGIRNRTTYPAIGGLLAGHLLATVVVAVGAGVLLLRVPGALLTMTIAGAGYLAWMGWGMATVHAAPLNVEAPNGAEEPQWKQAAKGFGVSGLNPKVFLLFLALLPQFVVPEASWAPAAQIVALGLIHVTSCAVIYTAVALGARTMLKTKPRVARIVTRISGIVLILVAVLLLGNQLRTLL
jgi:threonine/homoserine/homoserine lactone efflux protein